MTTNKNDAYLGNTNLKKAKAEHEYTPEQLQEYVKCMNDPIYFAENYIKVVHVDRGLIPLKLYDYQKEVINTFANTRRLAINQARQSGKCVSANTNIRVFNSVTREVLELPIIDFYERIHNDSMNSMNSYRSFLALRMQYNGISQAVKRVFTDKPKKLSENVERKFVDSIPLMNDIWKIETDTGYKPITHIHKTIPYREWRLLTYSGLELICADDHIVFDEKYQEKFVKDLKSGDYIVTKNGPEKVIIAEELEDSSNMFDITVDDKNERYYTNDILSHNTTVAVGIILHFILFNEHKLVGIIANKGSSAREILSRIQLAYQSLPKWLQQGIVEWNKGSLELENGCKVMAAATSSDAIRGKSVALLYIDECAFVRNWDEFFSSVYPTISSGKESKVLMTSTPNGLNHFYKICAGAMEGRNGYSYIHVPWYKVPGYDSAWKQDTLESLNFDHEKFRQEYEGMFLGSSGTLISGNHLKNLVEHEPVKTTSMGIKFYELPKEDRQYVCIVDVSRGKGLDYSAFQIIDITEMPYKQVCSFRDNMLSPMDFAQVIHSAIKMFNDAFTLIEINDIGEQVSSILHYDFEVETLLYTENAGRSGKRISGGFGKNIDNGIRTTKTVKAIGCNMLKLMVEQEQLIIRDEDTIDELKTFSKRGNSFEAESGCHDDLVMCLVLFGWLSDQTFFRDITDINTLQHLRERKQEDFYEDLLPLGFNKDDLVDTDNIDWF